MQLTGSVGTGTLVIDAASGLFLSVVTEAHATLPDGQVIKASARITFERGKRDQLQSSTGLKAAAETESNGVQAD